MSEIPGGSDASEPSAPAEQPLYHYAYLSPEQLKFLVATLENPSIVVPVTLARTAADTLDELRGTLALFSKDTQGGK